MDKTSNTFLEKRISEIDPEKDTKVRIMGTIVSKKDDSIFIDDGTGAIRIIPAYGTEFTATLNQRIRVFGRLRTDGKNADIIAEIIQDMTRLNIKLHNTVDEYWKKEAGHSTI